MILTLFGTLVELKKFVLLDALYVLLFVKLLVKESSHSFAFVDYQIVSDSVQVESFLLCEFFALSLKKS